MARVYQAYDHQLQRSVALKVMSDRIGHDPSYVRRFQREAVLAANLNHPAIVTIYDVGQQDGYYYIAMEYIRGRSLYALLRQHGALSPAEVAAVITPLAAALDYAHSHGAVHRDIKPHNVLLDTTGRVLLTDFGIAQPPDADREALTRTGTFMGTPEYISPEQAEGRRVDGRSDIYSLGIITYEALSGRTPFQGNTPQLILAHIHQLPPLLHTLRPDVPAAVDTVLQRALAKSPADRFGHASDLAAALTGVVQHHGGTIADRQRLAVLINSGTTPPSGETAAPPSGETAAADSYDSMMLAGLLKQPTPPGGKAAAPPAPARPPEPPRPLVPSATERRRVAAAQPTRRVPAPVVPPPAAARPAARAAPPAAASPPIRARVVPGKPRRAEWSLPFGATGVFFVVAVLVSCAALVVAFAFTGNNNAAGGNGAGGNDATATATAAPADAPPPPAPPQPSDTTAPTDTAAPDQPTNTPPPTNTPAPTDPPPTAPTDAPPPPAPTDPPPPPAPTDPPPPTVAPTDPPPPTAAPTVTLQPLPTTTAPPTATALPPTFDPYPGE